MATLRRAKVRFGERRTCGGRTGNPRGSGSQQVRPCQPTAFGLRTTSRRDLYVLFARRGVQHCGAAALLAPPFGPLVVRKENKGWIRPRIALRDPALSWLRGQDLNLRPSGYEEAQDPSQPLATASTPSQSLQSDTTLTQTSVQPVAAVSENFGANLVCGTQPAGTGLPLRPETLLTVKQVAASLGVSAATVYGLCERNELAHLRVANSIRISPSELATYLKAAQAAPSRRRLEQPSSEVIPVVPTTAAAMPVDDSKP